jgi:hypothetical protein
VTLSKGVTVAARLPEGLPGLWVETGPVSGCAWFKGTATSERFPFLPYP